MDSSHKASPYTATFWGTNAVRIVVGRETAGLFVKRALRYLFIFDDIDSQDKAFRLFQWIIESGFDESSYLGKCLKTPPDMGDGYIKLLPNGGAWFSSRLPPDCEENDIVEIESPPEGFSVSLLALLRTAFDKYLNLRAIFPEVQEVIQPQVLNRHNSLPNDYDVLIALDSIFHEDEATIGGSVDEMKFFVDITQKIVELSREREYLQFLNNAQTLGGLIAIKKIWMTLVEFWLASRERKVSVSEEMLGPVFNIFVRVVKTSLFKPEITVSRTAALLMTSVLGAGSHKDDSSGKKETIDILSTIGTAIIFRTAEDILAEAEEKLKAAKSEQELEQFYDKLFLSYPYFFSARLCFSLLSEYGEGEAREPAKAKGNAAEEKAARISDSLLNSLYDLCGDMFTRFKERILLADSEFDRNIQIFDVFDNRLLYPYSYRDMISKET